MTAEPTETADAFAIIGNEHRVTILQALMQGYREGETPLSFTDLMDRAGLDDSGQFNYHLKQLLERFVTERDGGYALTYAGRTVTAAIASGTLDSSITLDDSPIDGSCYACGASELVIRYPSDRVRVTCRSCGEEVAHILFPPAGVGDRSVERLVEDFDTWERTWRQLTMKGLCPECGSTVSRRLGRATETPTTGEVNVRAVLACDRCWVRGYSPPGITLLDHPAVVSFFWERGVDIRRQPLWEHDWALSSAYQQVVSDDPLQLKLRIPCKGDELVGTVDDSVNVIGIDGPYPIS